MRQSGTLRGHLHSPYDQAERTYVYWFHFCFIVITLMICPVAVGYAAKIIELNITGPIGPATADYIERGINKNQDAELFLVILDTPGGLDAATRTIVQAFLNSNVPVITYVSPTGARAASAGTYLLYASTIAAMAPGTQLGAASPVNLGSGLVSQKDEGANNSTMNKKVTNDAVATLRALAQLRGRDPVFAQNAVNNATTLTASEALKAGVINYVAEDKYDLLSQLNGIIVMQNNKKMILDTIKPDIVLFSPDWKTQFLSVITSPTVAYLLLLLGIYGIFFELVNPGFVLPGVVGAVSMLMALYALQLLPVNYAGLILIILGIAFIVAEAFTPSFGVLGVGGTVSFVLGSIMLINTDFAPYQIGWSVICAMAIINIVLLVVFLSMVVKSRRQRVRNGLITLVGAKGRSLGVINPDGQAVIRGEIWSVRSNTLIEADKNIRVILSEGLLLEVEEDFAAE